MASAVAIFLTRRINYDTSFETRKTRLTTCRPIRPFFNKNAFLGGNPRANVLSTLSLQRRVALGFLWITCGKCANLRLPIVLISTFINARMRHFIPLAPELSIANRCLVLVTAWI